MLYDERLLLFLVVLSNKGANFLTDSSFAYLTYLERFHLHFLRHGRGDYLL